MIEKRKKRKHTVDSSNGDDPWKPTRLETEVTNFLYQKLPTKDGRLSGMVVRTFDGSEAVEFLLNSPWAKTPQQANESTRRNSKPILFSNRSAAVSFMETLLQKQMFHRAVQAPKKSTSKRREDSKLSKTKAKIAKSGSGEETVVSTEKSSSTNNSSVAENKTPGPPAADTTALSSNKSSKPMRLEMSAEQAFILDDPLTVYVWIYEPPPGLFNWLAGSAVLLAIIVCCLFPVWPTELRSGAYYLTLCASGLFGLLLALALVRLVLYLIVWLATLGKYTFWLFPNYFEDCGFFDSFRPLYSLRQYNERSAGKKEKSRDKKCRLKDDRVHEPVKKLD